MADDRLPPKADILERNEEFNEAMARISTTYTRRKVVDTLLGVIIAIAIGISAGLLWVNYHLDQSINNSDDRQVQLMCQDLANENPNIHYSDCVGVLPAKIIGGK